jgi:solute:Na+ symporter, SSS family
MPGTESFTLDRIDYLAFAGYFLILSIIGFAAGRRERGTSDDYFLAGRRLPWYVVGGSFIASNISSEHFIGMIGAAFLYGICVAMWEWGNIWSFTLLIWFFIPFLLASKVFTTPEFMERRFNSTLRQFFAIVTVISNVVAFLAAVLYGGGLALHSLFGSAIARVVTPLAESVHGANLSPEVLGQWELWFAIVVLAVVAGAWAIYGGLSSVAWTDLFTLAVMIAGGIMVTVLGLYMLSGDEHSLIEGFRVMLQRNQAEDGVWAEAVDRTAPLIAHVSEYDRLSVIQPITHELAPWPHLLDFVSITIWYNVINQFMIQRVLGARNMYHARMGIVLAGYLKILMPVIVVVPGLILFARYPEVMLLPWGEVRPAADRGYVHMLQTLVPIGLRGLFLAALFGAIQSTVNSVLNSTATIVTLDVYKRMFRPDAGERALVRMGVWSSVVVLLIAIVLAGFIGRLGGGLFAYIQELYAFFAPPFAAVFLLGILFRRINARGATVAVFAGFAFGILLKLYVAGVSFTLGGQQVVLINPHTGTWIAPFMMQAMVNWAFCAVICVTVSLLTPPPAPHQVTDQLTFNWRRLNIFDDLGDHWYSSVVFWWGLFAAIVLALVVVFSGLWW